ncbi:DHS-like NAD/FAD-binding domain containing protein [Rhypophila sp. PSN 637]
MADSASAIAEEEKHEPLHILDRKAGHLAKLISQSKHMIVFTGAGISTSAGIPDFRGPEGAWTSRKQGSERTSQTTSTLQAIPTASHMVLVALQNAGLLKYLVSQNCDGLHRKSGILPDEISELHGNSNRESCRDCGKEYIPDFRAVARYEKTVHDHRTGRKCVMPGCKEHAETADLCLVLGSSLTVTPANEIPEIVGRRKKSGAKLVICNLQSTPIGGLASLRVFARTDELMVRVMEKLGADIPIFVLRRRLVVEVKADMASEKHSVGVYGLDMDDTPASFLKSVRLEYNRRCITREPFLINFRGGLEEDLGMKLRLELEFMGHYGEPNLEIVHDLTGAKGKDEDMVRGVYLLEYNPQNGEWETTLQS